MRITDNKVEDLLPSDQELCERSKFWSDIFKKYSKESHDKSIPLDSYLCLASESENEETDDTAESVDSREFEDNSTQDDPNFNVNDVLNETKKIIEKRKECWNETGIDRLFDTFSCDKIIEKVDNWLKSNTNLQMMKMTNGITINERNIVMENDSDNSLDSIDTAKYILSNRKCRKQRITMTIKEFRYSAQQQQSPPHDKRKAIETSRDCKMKMCKPIMDASITPVKRRKNLNSTLHSTSESDDAQSVSNERAKFEKAKSQSPKITSSTTEQAKRRKQNEFQSSSSSNLPTPWSIRRSSRKTPLKRRYTYHDQQHSDSRSESLSDVEKNFKRIIDKPSAKFERQNSKIHRSRSKSRSSRIGSSAIKHRNDFPSSSSSSSCSSPIRRKFRRILPKKRPSFGKHCEKSVDLKVKHKNKESNCCTPDKKRLKYPNATATPEKLDFLSVLSEISSSKSTVINSTALKSNNSMLRNKNSFVSNCESVSADSTRSSQRSLGGKSIVIYTPNKIQTPTGLIRGGRLTINEAFLEQTIGSDLKNRFIGDKQNFQMECSAKSKLIYEPPPPSESDSGNESSSDGDSSSDEDILEKGPRHQGRIYEIVTLHNEDV